MIEEVTQGKAVIKGDFFAGFNGAAGGNPDFVFVYDGVAIFVAGVVGVFGDVVGVISVNVESIPDFKGPDVKVARFIIIPVGFLKLLPELLFVEVVACVFQEEFIFFNVVYGKEACSVDF